MRVKTIKSFYDLKEDVKREVGDEFVVSETRFNEIITNGGAWIEQIIEEVPLKNLSKSKKKIEHLKKETKEDLNEKLGE